MTKTTLEQSADIFQQNLTDLQQQAQNSTVAPDVLAQETLSQLSLAVEQLQATEQKLLEQNEALLEAEESIQIERQRYHNLQAECRQTEEVLRQEHQELEIERKRLRTVLDIIPVGLWVVDAYGEILVQSVMARTIWAEDVLADDIPRDYKGWWPQTNQPLAPADWSRIRALTQGEISLNEEIEIEAFDGSRKTILSSAAPIKDEKDEIVGAVVLNMDITRRKAREVLLKDERARIARELHDGLAQNLYFLGLKLDYIRNQVQSEPEQAICELAALEQTVQTNIQEVRRAIFALRPLDLEELDFVPAIRQYLYDFGEQASLTMHLDIADESETLPAELEPIFFRLVQEGLTNIAKHAQARQVWVKLTIQPGQLACLTIQDDGLGFNPQALPTSGSNMGLRQMRERVAQFNGHFEVRSEPYRGTDLYIELPLTRKIAMGKSTKPTPIRILIADDHTMVRQGLSQICGVEPDMQVVGQAVNGRAACALASSVQPDVVVMDINMPIMDGVQATRQLMAANPAIGVIILTTYRQDQYVFEAIKAGARAYLLKDVGSNELLQAIRTIAAGDALLDPPLAKKMISEFHQLQAQFDPSTPTTTLLEQELNILRLVAQGLSNSEIGQELNLSEKTIRNRLTIIFGKLHVNNRTQAALYAVQQGLTGAGNDDF